MRFNRGTFFSAVLGGLVVAVVMSVLPAVAANGDPMYLGQKNNATRATKLISKGGLHVYVGRAGNPALTLQVVGDTPPLRVNSSGMVANLNADMVDGRHGFEFLHRLGKARDSRHADEADNATTLQGYAPNELLRVTQANTANAPDRNGIAVQAAITAPGPGWLIVSGSIDARGTDYEIYSCLLEVDGTRIAGSGRVSTVDLDVLGGINDEENCSTEGVVSVAAGDHTVALSMGRTGAGVTYGEAVVWALFVPFNGQGNTHTP